MKTKYLSAFLWLAISLAGVSNASGAVTATWFWAGTLEVTGNSGNDSVEISETGTGYIDVKVNGVSIKIYDDVSGNDLGVQASWVDDIDIDLGTGDDKATFVDLDGPNINFTGAISGSVSYAELPYGDKNGVVNFVDCAHLSVSGLDATNTKVFVVGSVATETSCVLNVSNSTDINATNIDLTSNGKGAFMVHSDSDVTIGGTSSIIRGYYHEINLAASQLTMSNTELEQQFPGGGDSHSAIWTSSSYRRTFHGVPNVLFNSSTTGQLNSVTFDMNSGRPVLTGNGSPSLVAVVTLKDPVFQISNSTKGLVGVHANWFSIELKLDPNNAPISGLVDYVSANTSNPLQGFGRFVNYYATPSTPLVTRTAIADGVSIHNITVH